MNLSISNIAWESCYDTEVYQFLEFRGFNGIEIAPTKLFGSDPYNSSNLEKARKFSRFLSKTHHLTISSIQSIWYGINERIFSAKEERVFLLEYTKKAILFAVNLGCNNLVFGCPRNRTMNDISNNNYYSIAIDFFHDLGEFAWKNNAVIALEPNPVIYNTNFMNNTEETIEICKKVSSPGCKVNFDLGAFIYNTEPISILSENLDLIHHIHISEPNLTVIKKRKLHKDVYFILKNNYTGFVSIEMKLQKDLQIVYDTISYVQEVFS